jgi:intracellular sulfur oxidation DsrE/DsrF family protein
MKSRLLNSLAMGIATALMIASSSAFAAESLGVQMEVCGAATKHFGVDNASIPEEMTVVGNGFISLIGWQTQGYVPMTF